MGNLTNSGNHQLATLGQFGSIHIAGTDSVTSNGVAGMEEAVFCAITFLEDTKFATSGGLLSANNLKFINSASGQTGISNNSAVTGSEVFPKGVTIYGRFNTIKLQSGRVIAYLG